MNRQGHSQSGFSLMEVVVALGILATTAIGFVNLLQGSIEGTRQVEERYLARVVADNQLTDVLWRRLPLEQGVTEGVERQLGRDFTWQMTVLQGPREGLLVVDVQVRRGTEAGSPVIAQATTLRAAQ